MSLTKILMSPIKLFKKEVITFVVIRRYDLGVIKDNLRYIAVRPNASISVLRQKVWHLLDLPDYCDEVIILKSGEVEIPLTELRKGNDPHRPYILEVWLPGKKEESSTTIPGNMIMGNDGIHGNFSTTFTEKIDGPEKYTCISESSISNETMVFNQLRNPPNLICTDFKPSELSCRISTTSIFRLNRRKSKDKLTDLLLKIQSDLCNLTTKLTVLENKIST